jgi:predicted nucleotidyltransferase
MNEVYTQKQLKNKLAPIFFRHNVRRAVLFGSYGKGTPSPNSDVDIFVDSGLRGLDFFGLLNEVALAVDKNVDMIDAIEIEKGSPIENEINSTGVLIFEK